jgi:hypothetical protein
MNVRPFLAILDRAEPGSLERGRRGGKALGVEREQDEAAAGVIGDGQPALRFVEGEVAGLLSLGREARQLSPIASPVSPGADPAAAFVDQVMDVMPRRVCAEGSIDRRRGLCVKGERAVGAE